MTDEKKLLKKLRKKQKGAIEDAVRIYTPYLSTVIYNAVRGSLPKEDIEEIMSDTFVALWKNAERLDEERESLRPYLAKIARNNVLRRLKETKEVLTDDESVLLNVGITEMSFEENSIWDTVLKLGEPDSEIFVRFYKYDESLIHISKVLGLKLSTVKSKLMRGKKKLKSMIKEDAI